jgi:hypothetical protein
VTLKDQLSGIGFGESAEKKRELRGRFLAAKIMPWVKEAVDSVKGGKVEFDEEAVDLCFAALDWMGPLIDEAEFDEQDALALHAGLSFVVRARSSGMMNDRKMRICMAFADVFVELYSQVAEFTRLEVDRSGVE